MKLKRIFFILSGVILLTAVLILDSYVFITSIPFIFLNIILFEISLSMILYGSLNAQDYGIPFSVALISLGGVIKIYKIKNRGKRYKFYR
ncbi:hypothetical protein [Picrophilus oshimae]|uniref:hypothetical protein n=1 Tax=Picrophilus oshimae TaxID=46632 RepID=UPI0009FBBA6F|nr:hypothetical protein [Picrophilus oshimae]